MATWLETIKSYGTTNTMKNPLDSILPKIGINRPNGAKPPIIKASPIKEKTKSTVDEIKKDITDVKAKVTPVIFFGVIAFLVYTFAKK
jgi:hypothetical protein